MTRPPRARIAVVASAVLGALACALGLAVPPPDDAMPLPAAVRPVGAPRFEQWDVFVDAGAAALAAYQVEVKASGASAGHVKIAGVEGGDAGAPYNSAPFYDPLAMQDDTVIIGALAQGAAPTSRVRVASVHVMVDVGTPPTEMTVRLMTAGQPDGGRIDVAVSVERRKR